MEIDRRTLVGAALAVAAGGVAAAGRAATDAAMHGLIGRMKAVPGQRDAVIAILLEGIGAMPGCLSYIVAKDPTNADAIWITEVWIPKAATRLRSPSPPSASRSPVRDR